MAVITDNYALYHGDCIDIMGRLPDESVHLSIYSPPFCGLYNYSSSERDLSNCRSYDEFFEHYEYVVKELARLTIPGRCTAVHCMDIPRAGANLGGGLADFPGDIIRLHERLGWHYAARYAVWKEPLGVRNRTMAKGLAHKQIVDDASLCDVASADYVLLFRKNGENPVPVTHDEGLTFYAGSRQMPADLLKYRGWTGKQTENRFSHWIWRQYASAFWDDVRIDRVLPYKESREPDDERHVHPLQLDVIERTVILRSNPGEVVFTPFMGVGSEVYGAVLNGRKGVGAELKRAYYNQAVKNCKAALHDHDMEQQPLLARVES
jgi:DNA modification methylase|tara:strand:+ start:1403 stop:2365 length:963 start_codon:yes stop_codon:yes gene_type:complete